MSKIIIEVENLSKSYVINHEGLERYTAIRDVITQKAKKMFFLTSSLKSVSGVPVNEKSPTKEEFWALKDLNFEINQGDRVGIIGRNGAGKSTLLKVLSRITEPTNGRIKINGRVASLLEVGTGFHPELTGRENIYLNGAILGMSRREIKSKFDEIVDFAEVDKFLDTPVKRYSSGMYVRLAFAVAAHLEPEVLIVDEVLAVGDAQFQKKCLGKMEDVSKNSGRTVLFVSHNMAAIKSLCTTAIYLHKGQKVLKGDIQETLEKYICFDQSELNTNSSYNREILPIGKKMFIQYADCVDDQTTDFFQLQINLIVKSKIKAKIGVNIKIKDSMGFPVAFGCSHYFIPELIGINVGENKITLNTEQLNLAIGNYKLSAELVQPGSEQFDLVEDAIQFELSNDGIAKRNYGVMQSWGYGSFEIKFKNI